MKALMIFLISFIFTAQISYAESYKVFFKGKASDQRDNIVEPDIIFTKPDDKIIFNAKNVDLNSIVVLQINRNGQFAEIDANRYRDLVDKSYLITNEDFIYLYYSKKYFSSGAFGLSIVGSFYKKQAEALKKLNYNQNFKDRVDHILKNLTPLDDPMSRP